MHIHSSFKHLFLSLITLIFFSACGGGSSSSSDTSVDVSSRNTMAVQLPEDDSWSAAVEHLNEIRSGMGMIELQDNELLSIAAKNHSLFLTENYGDGIHYGHNEVAGLSHFTGVDAWDRVAYMGYEGFDGENISSGRDTYKAAIDSLMTAIYHRFGLLSLTANEIGGDMTDVDGYEIYVTESGNSRIDDICAEDYTEYPGIYYSGVCTDANKLIPAEVFLTAWYATAAQNPVAMLYPYEDQIGVSAIFENHETPDPLPDITAYTGNPISIVFNEYHVEDVSMVSFKIYDIDGIEITNTRILTQESDPNHRFSTHQYAMFPLDPLTTGTTYSVEASFIVDGEAWEKNWSFTTAN